MPIVEGTRCTFLYRGEADEVFLVHRIFGLPDHPALRRLHGTDRVRWRWSCPRARGSSTSWRVARRAARVMNHPLNPHLARSPVGSSSGSLRVRP